LKRELLEPDSSIGTRKFGTALAVGGREMFLHTELVTLVAVLGGLSTVERDAEGGGRVCQLETRSAVPLESDSVSLSVPFARWRAAPTITTSRGRLAMHPEVDVASN